MNTRNFNTKPGKGRSAARRDLAVLLLAAFLTGGAILYSGCASPGDRAVPFKREWDRSPVIDWSLKPVQLDHPPTER